MERKSEHRRFFVYRYQILARIDPESPQFVYTTPDQNYMSVEELRADKNRIFSKMLQSIEHFQWPYAEITHNIAFAEDDLFLIRLGVNRPTEIRTEDFKSVQTSDWPWIYIYIDNDSENQYLLTEIDRDAWDGTDITIRMLQDNFNSYLEAYYLLVEIEPLIEQRAFWAFVERHKGRIKVVEFDMISPNMSNISSKSKWPLQEIRDEYNATRQRVRLENTADRSIDVKPDEFITSMAEYSSNGGGKVRFRIQGFKGYKSLSEDKIEVEFDDFDIQSDDPKHFHKIAKILFDMLTEL